MFSICIYVHEPDPLHICISYFFTYRWWDVLLERRVIIDVKSAIFGMLKDDGLHQVERKLVNLSILVAKMCISKFKYGTPVNIIHLFDSELLVRHKQIPFEFRQKVTNSLS